MVKITETNEEFAARQRREREEHRQEQRKLQPELDREVGAYLRTQRPDDYARLRLAMRELATAAKRARRDAAAARKRRDEREAVTPPVATGPWRAAEPSPTPPTPVGYDESSWAS